MSLLWKSVIFWIAVLFGLAVVTALIPGSERWPDAVAFVIILLIAIGQIWYVNRSKLANPDAYAVSPRARRMLWIANIGIFVLIATTNFLEPHTDGWKIGLTVLLGAVALVSAFRLLKPPPAESL